MALRIGDMLVAAGFVTEEQVEEALASQKESGLRLGAELVALGFVTEVQLIQVLSNQLSVPWVSLHHIEMTRELLDLVPADVADRYGLIPVYRRVVRREGETLFVAMDDPTNEDAIAEVRRASGLPVKPMVAPPTDIRNAIRVYYLGMAPKAPEAPRRARRHTDEIAIQDVAAKAAATPEPEPASAPEAASAPTPEAASEPEPTVSSEVEAAEPSHPKTDPAPAPEEPTSAEDEVSLAEAARAKARESAPKKPKQRFVTLTLLDGTTVRLPAPRKGGEDAEAEPRGGALTAADLVRALLAKGQGAAVDDVLGKASWEVLCATILQLMLKKGLVADWEFVEAYKKNLGQ
ncbi:MAG: hypothetical protein H6724_07855 [Sandaracinus sp.]|nr:hypothetical protein [Sandaracinus sp.]MCB9619351.1 hypothetical protein [Sandaracinus sp.]